MSITNIRQELLQGSSIENVCLNHGLSFKDLFMLCDRENRKENPEKELTTGELYISKKGKDYFVLRKGQVYYGAFYSLDDARQCKSFIRFYCPKLGKHVSYSGKVCPDFECKEVKE